MPSKKKNFPDLQSPISRRTRKNIDTTSIADSTFSSPLRRSTRRPSQEREIVYSPMPSRARKSLNRQESDSEDQQAITPGLTKSARQKRQSYVTQIVEEAEDEHEEETEKQSSQKEEDLNELELRTRSISKSPSANPSPKAKFSPAAKATIEQEDFTAIVDSPKPEVPRKIFKSRDKTDDKSGSELSYPDEDYSDASTELPPIEQFTRKRRQSEKNLSKPCYVVVDRLTKSCDKKMKDNNGEAKDHNSSQTATDKSQDADSSVRARRSIHGNPKGEEVLNEIEQMMRDFDGNVEEIPETPESVRKTPSGEKQTPKSTGKSLTIVSTTPTTKNQTDAFIQSATKTPINNGGAKTALKTPKSSITQRVDKTSITPGRITMTPKTSKDDVIHIIQKTPKSDRANITRAIDEDMDISMGNQSDMEITLMSPNKKTLGSPAKFATAKGSTPKLSRSWSQSVTNNASIAISPQANTSHSLSSHIDHVKTSAAKNKSEHVVVLGEENIEEKSPVKQHSRSWNQSVKINVSHEESVLPTSQQIKHSASKVPYIQRRKSISSDESDGAVEKNLFIDDEAEVGSEESITESELQYLEENEIPDDGESLGSQDSNELPSDESDKEEDDSFIDTDEDVSDEYSMDSKEQEIEKSPERPKRKSRIIMPSSSEEEGHAVEKKSTSETTKSPHYLRDKIADSIEAALGQKEDEAVAPQTSTSKVNLKRKRDDKVNESVVVKTKRIKIGDSFANDSEAMHMENLSGVAALFDEESSPSEDEGEEKISEIAVKAKKSKKSSNDSVDVESVLSKCQEIIGAHSQEKKVKEALKRVQKAQKKAKKIEAQKIITENLESPNGENKENSLKKKKKNKQKKQKLVNGEFRNFQIKLLID